eukprot:2004812-Pyramimonas_sp.AAC.1
MDHRFFPDYHAQVSGSGGGRRFLPVAADTRLRVYIRCARTDTSLWLSGSLHGSGCAATGPTPNTAAGHGGAAP